MERISSGDFSIIEVGVNAEQLISMIHLLRAGAICVFEGKDASGKVVRGRVVATHPELCRATLIA